MSASATTALPASVGNGSDNHGAAAGSSSASAASGPPYLCPTCKTSYSRLEYLRRHERRHADIRPFVCDCGKGFSRSDVLSRHKRQCNVVLHGGEAGDTSAASNKSAGGGAANGARKAAAPSGRANRKASGATRNNSARKSGSAASRASDQKRASHDDDEDDDDDSGGGMANAHAAHMHHHGHAHGLQPPPPPPPSAVGNSFPFPQQPGVSSAPSAASALMPPAPYGADGSMNPSAAAAVAAAASANMPFGGMLPHHMSSFNNLVNQQHNYPSSPESNGTLSQHGSPRFAARDMARHGSNGSRFSLRKGGSFDHIGPRGTVPSGFTPNQFAPEFWEALDPAAKNASGMAGMDYVSSGGSNAQSYGMVDGSSGGTGLSVSGSGQGGSSSMSGMGGSGVSGVTTPRGEPHRFGVANGPLSPFSSIALSSTMSPYLSAFSNARDTPFVASPSRGIIPGTPGSSLNVFDWTMRPPSKPASSIAMAKRDSLSHPNAPTTGAASSGGPASSPSGGPSSAAPSKRKREEDEGSRKSPRNKDGTRVKTEEALDEDHRTAAELLDSLRTGGARVSNSSATDAALSSHTSPTASSAPAANAAAVSADDDGDVGAGKQLPVSQAPSSEPTTKASVESPPKDTKEEVDNSMAAPTATTTGSESFLEQASVSAGPAAFALSLPRMKSDSMSGAGNTVTSRQLSVKQDDEEDDGSRAPGNLTLSQLVASSMPPTSVPATAANIAQSSWEALMNGNGWASVAGPESAGGASKINNDAADDDKKSSIAPPANTSSSFTPTTTASAS